MEVVSVMPTASPSWEKSLPDLLAAATAAGSGEAAKTRLVAALRALDSLVAEQAKTMPGELAHYLQRRSYEKAAQFLAAGVGGEPGACRPKS